MIDVLLPYYGDPDLVRTAITSVLAQTSPRWRLVVVDDASPDTSLPDWLDALGDDRVEYHRNEHNLGPSGNYTRALSYARHGHLVVMGADDVMLPHFVALLEREVAAAPDAAVVQCGVQVIDEVGTPVLPMADRIKRVLRPRGHGNRTLTQEQAVASLLCGNWTYFPSLCWRRTAVEKVMFRPEFNLVQDLALLVDVLLDGGTMRLAEEVSFQYRRHRGSDSAVKTVAGSRFDEERDYFARVERELRARGMRRAALHARLHLTSRLHAVALLSSTRHTGSRADRRRLVRHAFA